MENEAQMQELYKDIPFSKFKKDSIKNLLDISKLRSFFRNLKKKSEKNDIKKTNLTDGTFVGGSLYTNHKKISGCYEETQENQFWKCNSVYYKD